MGSGYFLGPGVRRILAAFEVRIESKSNLHQAVWLLQADSMKSKVFTNTGDTAPHHHRTTTLLDHHYRTTTLLDHHTTTAPPQPHHHPTRPPHHYRTTTLLDHHTTTAPPH
ncbi:hypothetical protein AAMO2058_001684100 [Amorphochlora amoebiformis]